MSKFYNSILDKHREFIEKQETFFVASAPLNINEPINLLPKEIDCFRIISPNRVAYMDVIGNGDQTSANILENGRITFLFYTRDGTLLFLRLFGNGYTMMPGDPAWDGLWSHFNLESSGRQIIVVADIDKVQKWFGR